jgi:Type II secretion system (T2SS), protein G
MDPSATPGRSAPFDGTAKLLFLRCASCETAYIHPVSAPTCLVCGAELIFLLEPPTDPADAALSGAPTTVEQTSIESPYFLPSHEELTSILHDLQQHAADEESAPPIARRRFPLTVTLPLLLLLLVTAGWVAIRWADQSALHQSVALDAGRLAKLIESYRRETGLYPDAEIWRRWITGSDAAEFLDPWRQPYLFGVDSRAFWISTYGADGRRGGTAEDEDVTFVFRYTNPRMALTHGRPK